MYSEKYFIYIKLKSDNLFSALVLVTYTKVKKLKVNSDSFQSELISYLTNFCFILIFKT